MNTLSILSLVLSVIAVCSAAFFSFRQNQLQSRTNSASAVVDLLGQFREPSLHSSIIYVCYELNAHDPDKGIIGLPPDVREKVYDVCYFIQQFCVLIILDIIPEREFTALLRARTVAIWDAIMPFVEAERQINSSAGPEFMTTVEAFAEKASRISPELGQKILQNWVAQTI